MQLTWSHSVFVTMKYESTLSLTALILTAAMAGCSPAPDAPLAEETAATGEPETTATVGASPAPSAVTATTPASDHTLRLEGLGALNIGEPVPEQSGWKERGAQASDECRIISSPHYPGAYAIVEGGKVRRITIGEGSDVKLAEGIGVGASEAEVKSWFGGFREEGHAYENAPAKYLTAPNARSGDPALRFEIGQDGKVSFIHVGTMPVLGYVEGCA